MSIQFKIIEVGTAEHNRMLDLRHRILRAPLNLIATEEELAKDVNYTLLGAFLPNNELTACCFLSPIDGSVVQLRQMAVDDLYQGKGYGSQIMKFAEDTAKQQNYNQIHLHARKTAEAFYEKLGYEIQGDYFLEIGIPHIAMTKILEQ